MANMHEAPSGHSDFQNKGHVGKFSGVTVVANATQSFTASYYGAGGLIVGESSTTGHAHLSHGGSLNLAHLTVGTLYEVGVSEVACNNKKVYVLKRTG
jgi:hypothetical protein|tara:strand:- start:276 stop:569 length:294 start_codon:yes stop_codon:yes gene_type:complete